MASIPQIGDGFDPQRIVWRMVDSPYWYELFVTYTLLAPPIESTMNQGLARSAFLMGGRVDL